MYYPALQKVLVLLSLVFVFCRPFKIKIVKKVNTATSPPCSWGEKYKNFFPLYNKESLVSCLWALFLDPTLLNSTYNIFTLFPQKYNFLNSCSCFFQCQFSFVLFSVKPENVQLLTNITANNTCPGGYWNFTCSAGTANPQVTSYQLLENDIAVDTSSSGMWIRTLSNSGEFTYKCLANNTVGSTISANEKKIAISGNNFTHIFSPQNVTVYSI